MALPECFLIRNVDIWNASGVQTARDVLVEHGRIAEISPSGSRSENPETIFEGQSKALIPAGVDLQVHLRVPGQSEKETAYTGLRAALRGGFAAVLTMPNTRPILDTAAACELARTELASAERSTGVRVYLSAAMTLGQEGRKAVDMQALARAGVRAFTDDGKGVAQDSVMDEVFKAAAELDLPLLQHAEVPGHGAALAAGPTQQRLGLKVYPARSEADMVARDLDLLEKYPKLRYHVLHVSAHETLANVARGKAKGLHVSAEVTPHHLFFSSDDIPEGDTNFKMNPPLRGPEHRSALRTALREGLLDCVSTDHAPHEISKKGPDFEAAAFGTTGLETSLRCLFALHGAGELSAERLVEVFSTWPARFLGLGDELGLLEVGRPFRAVWADPKASPTKITLQDLESLSKNNCFLGAELPGKILGFFNEAGLFRF